MQGLSPWRLKNRPQDTALFGLCAFETTFKPAEPNLNAEFVVEFGGKTTVVPAKAVLTGVDEAVAQAVFHIHTHLIENGIQTLRVSVRWLAGATLSWPDQEFEVDNSGALAKAVTRDLAAYGTPLVHGNIIDSSLYPYGAGRAVVWFEEPAPVHETELSFEPAKSNEAARRHLERWGFCVLKQTVPTELIQRFNLEIDDALKQGSLVHTPGSSDRILGAHRLEAGKAIWLFQPVLRFLRDWFQDEPCACQSLLFINGSQQQPHQDTIHLTPYPFGMMCGVWIPLEDVREQSGELVVYPGSHRTTRLTTEILHLAKVKDDYSSYVAFDSAIAKLISDGGYQRMVYRPKAGQVLVWHENLIHGGSKRENPELTRRSFVSHYFARGSVAYYDSRGDAASLELIT